MNTKSLLKIVGVLVGLLLVASACGDSSESSSNPELDPATETPGAVPVAGGDDDDDDDDDDEVDSSGSPASNGGDDICVTMRQLADVDPFGDITSFDGSTFASIEEFLSRAADEAPADVRSDLLALRDGFNEFGAVLAKYDFNFFDAELQSELTSFDLDDLSDAGERISSYMSETCGIDFGADDIGDDLGGATLADPTTASSLAETFAGLEGSEAVVQALVQFFGVDQELAECLNEELGDFDTSSPDPSLLTQEVCGTTLLEVITNIGSGG